jgi:hypothetical protein
MTKAEDQRKAFLYAKWIEERDESKRKEEASKIKPVEETRVFHDKKRDALAQQNRERYPEIAKFVDEVRKYFPDATVISIRPLTPEEKASQAPANPVQPE